MWIKYSPYAIYVLIAFGITILCLLYLWFLSIKNLDSSGDDN